MDFINVNSWFERKYKDSLKDRYWTFKIALNIFKQRNGENILETGTTRQENDWGGGCSTLIFGNFLKYYNIGRLYTVDISPANMEVSINFTSEYKDYIEYTVADSIEYLKNFDKRIDFLYLDSLDCPEPPHSAEIAQQHNLAEFKTIEGKLHEDTIVMLDDNNLSNGGKTRLTKEYLKGTNNWMCLMDFQQSLWIRK